MKIINKFQFFLTAINKVSKEKTTRSFHTSYLTTDVHVSQILLAHLQQRLLRSLIEKVNRGAVNQFSSFRKISGFARSYYSLEFNENVSFASVHASFRNVFYTFISIGKRAFSRRPAPPGACI